MAKEANKRPKPKVTKVTKLKVVDRVFASDGEVLIKVTRAGRVEFISLPITSDKYRQAVQRYDSQSPRPPRRPLNRDEAEEAGLPRGTLVPDLWTRATRRAWPNTTAGWLPCWPRPFWPCPSSTKRARRSPTTRPGPTPWSVWASARPSCGASWIRGRSCRR